MKPISEHKGFTLIELMTVVMIAAVLLAVGVPTFTDSIRRNAVQADVAALRSGFARARTAAVTEATNVSICPANVTQDACANDWTEGWLIFLNEDNDGVVDPGERIIHVNNGTSHRNTLRVFDADAVDVNMVTYNRRGSATQAGIALICDQQNTIGRLRALTFTRTGQVVAVADVTTLQTNPPIPGDPLEPVDETDCP